MADNHERSARALRMGGAVLLLVACGMMTDWQMTARAGWSKARADNNGQPMVLAHIDGTPVRAQINPGATVVVIPHRVARQVMRQRASALRFETPVWTASGKVMAAATTLQQVEIDGVAVRNVEALVMPKGVLRHVLVGMSYLDRLRRQVVQAHAPRMTD